MSSVEHTYCIPFWQVVFAIRRMQCARLQCNTFTLWVARAVSSVAATIKFNERRQNTMSLNATKWFNDSSLAGWLTVVEGFSPFDCLKIDKTN